ncbi:sugar ABC transporter permease [Flavimobilis marinus]|uniref:Carbohydrate ABC transporter membrane protein 2, CUT1 family n=1 Tax=Flavimobilis marinus TaxID=285351 RepID=A0A1I2FX03_9MICO|nr:sugar ABC transporter permease [Flavimobilis marinus]GHG51072.1 sugar ABC transporter permease [Flavimobilis marinus]SFF09046.1 carbohydrate ABC transporter membrane protein 2, CUT1 family [Flavimobilis marinus]
MAHITGTPAAPVSAVRAENKMGRGRWFREVGWRYIVAVFAILYAAFPIIYIISVSLNDSQLLAGSNDLFSDITTTNYAALGDTYFWNWVINTLFIGSVTAVGTVLMGAAAAYTFSRFRFKGRRFGLTALLVIQMFPQLLAFVAIYLLLLSLGEVVPVLGLDSRIALIMVYLGGALGVNTFLMYGFFNTIPVELDEAAKIDGATHAQIFWTIILRLVAPILAVVGLLSFISSFSDFLLAKLILVDQRNWTLAVGLYGWVSDQLEANWGLFAAGATISAIPVVLLFLFLQKYIVSGLTAGSVKG